MIRFMLDASIEKQTKHLQSVKAQIEKDKLKVVLSDEAELGGFTWRVLKHKLLKPEEFDFYKFWVSSVRY